MTDTDVNRIRLTSPASQHSELLYTLSWVLLIVAVLTVAYLAIRYHSASVSIDAQDLTPPSAEARWADVVPLFDGADWSIFENGGSSVVDGGGSLAKRFRLAGTFFSYDAAKGDSREAILHDLSDQSQRIVRENELVGDVRVMRIFRDRVVLMSAAGEEELWLEFSSGGVDGVSGDGASIDTSGISGATGLFGGERMGESRWVFKREALVEYYKELMDEPDRLVKVFDSLKPLYDGQRRITGYVLGVEGEKEFFDAVGLKEGDIVRSVNSMKMTSRSRAEYFISEFVQDRANVFDLVIERSGETKRVLYQVR